LVIDAVIFLLFAEGDVSTAIPVVEGKGMEDAIVDVCGSSRKNSNPASVAHFSRDERMKEVIWERIIGNSRPKTEGWKRLAELAG
jgi:hypothetical protein